MESIKDIKKRIKEYPPDQQVKILLKEYKNMQQFFCEAIFTHIENVMYRVKGEDIELDCKAILYTFIQKHNGMERRITVEATSFEDAKKQLLKLSIDPSLIHILEVKYWL